MAGDAFKCMRHLSVTNVINILITSVRSDIYVYFLGTWHLISRIARLQNPSCQARVVLYAARQLNRAALSQCDLMYLLTFSKQKTPACIRCLRRLKCVKLMHNLWLAFFIYRIFHSYRNRHGASHCVNSG